MIFVSSKPFHRKRPSPLDSFAILLHIPYDRQLSAVKDEQVGVMRFKKQWKFQLFAWSHMIYRLQAMLTYIQTNPVWTIDATQLQGNR